MFLYQVIGFVDIFLRYTPGKHVLIIVPVNTLQNWIAEFNQWLPVEVDEQAEQEAADKERAEAESRAQATIRSRGDRYKGDRSRSKKPCSRTRGKSMMGSMDMYDMPPEEPDMYGPGDYMPGYPVQGPHGGHPGQYGPMGGYSNYMQQDNIINQHGYPTMNPHVMGPDAMNQGNMGPVGMTHGNMGPGGMNPNEMNPPGEYSQSNMSMNHSMASMNSMDPNNMNHDSMNMNNMSDMTSNDMTSMGSNMDQISMNTNTMDMRGMNQNGIGDMGNAINSAGRPTSTLSTSSSTGPQSGDASSMNPLMDLMEMTGGSAGSTTGRTNNSTQMNQGQSYGPNSSWAEWGMNGSYPSQDYMDSVYTQQSAKSFSGTHNSYMTHGQYPTYPSGGYPSMQGGYPPYGAPDSYTGYNGPADPSKHNSVGEEMNSDVSTTTKLASDGIKTESPTDQPVKLSKEGEKISQFDGMGDEKDHEGRTETYEQSNSNSEEGEEKSVSKDEKTAGSPSKQTNVTNDKENEEGGEKSEQNKTTGNNKEFMMKI